MHGRIRTLWRVAALVAFAVALSGDAARAQDAKSATLIKEFAQLAGGDMRYVAVKVPGANDEFVGALHIPGVQLLVIWAHYKQPTLLTEMLGKRNYQGVYTDLNSASYTDAVTRIFLEDLREDGLVSKRQNDNSAFDSYQSGTKRVSFDGDWKKQNLSEKDYQDTFASADEHYTKALELLVAELKKGS